MERFAREWFAPWISEKPGVAWCAGWFAVPAVASFFLAAMPETGAFSRVLLLVIGGVHAFAALGLLRGLKSGWHVATFLAFLTIVTRIVAVACAPGEIADGDMHLLEAAADVIVLAVAILVYAYLRKREVRTLFSVPASYRIEEKEPE